ncbi:sensor histidine kinase [Alicyclobacillus kakegawensis]|uniref:sensor histidine kinase n=1 Tax=Alicyclobacillus kakegawensis TaxID=392012 RepID=UPI00082CAA51|nr:HAMP domain-containing sensor histidine kinase [Alicyclobacillus kakegawensis]
MTRLPFQLPRSLRAQLLVRCLAILAGLLVFIGFFQYLAMSRFVYQNTAHMVHTQVRALPLRFWLHDAPRLEGRWAAGSLLNPGAAFTDSGTASPGKARGNATVPRESGASSGSTTDAVNADPSLSTATGNPTAAQRPLPIPFTLPGAIVTFIDDTGGFHELFHPQQADAAPHLPKTVYQAALTYGQADNQYQIVKTPAGAQLVVLTPIGPPGQPSGLIQVSADVAQIRHVVVQQLLVFIILAAAALLAAILALTPTVRRTLVPLSSMIRTVRHIGAGNLAERVQLVRPQTEVAVLAESFNAMLERLAQAFANERIATERMRQFVADASHELRTPLTSIRGFLEVLQRGAAKNPEQLEQALTSMRAETERLSHLVEDLLTLARLDGQPELNRRPADLGGLLDRMRPQLEVLAGSRQVRLDVACPALVEADVDKMKQVVLNLFQNAVHHTAPDTGRIEVSVQAEPDAVLLTVRDNGSGIPPDRLPHIFDRFYRIDASRSRAAAPATQGAGLGLAITQSIVQLHGGNIECESELGVGTTFTVRLPPCNPDPAKPGGEAGR